MYKKKRESSSKFLEDPEGYNLSSSIPEVCKIAIPRFLDSSRSEILRGIAIPTSEIKLPLAQNFWTTNRHYQFVVLHSCSYTKIIFS